MVSRQTSPQETLLPCQPLFADDWWKTPVPWTLANDSGPDDGQVGSKLLITAISLISANGVNDLGQVVGVRDSGRQHYPIRQSVPRVNVAH
jgi:hypothetical protein